MNSISVLQVGDIHYPLTYGKYLGDVKDKGLRAVAEGTVPGVLPQVLRAISNCIERNSISEILICGDLTEKGDTRAYKVCVDHLVKTLNLKAINADGVHVVPGNHDVNRSLCDPDHTELHMDKFEPLLDAWNTSYSGVLATNQVRRTSIDRSGCGLEIYSMNSCVGCGEWRMLPEAIRAEFGDLLLKLRDEDPDKAFKLEGEQLDTPMFLHEDITILNESVSNINIKKIPIVLAHHNLLPQELQRLELYTELINSGQFRTTLTNLARPIIYCHGHIHKDPIELISDGTLEDSQLICVSAPEISDGFNELVVHFSHERQPLGLEVVFHRLRDSGMVVESGRHRIPFDNRKKFLTQDLEDLKTSLTENRMRFEQIKRAFEELRGAPIEKDAFSDCILEAGWLGLVEIDSRDFEPQFWVIRRTWA